MTDTVTFTPKSEKNYAENMQAFISFCRNDLAVFGKELEFGAIRWDVTDYFERRGRHHRIYLNFTASHTGNRNVLGPPLPEPIGTFARAYVRYVAGDRRKRSPSADIAAIRLIVEALRDLELPPDIALLDAQILDRAMEISAKRFTPGFAVVIGGQLQQLAKFLNDKQLCQYAPASWKHGQLLQRAPHLRVGKEFEERRRKKYPSDDLLDAIASAFHLAQEPRDQILTAVLAILCSAPDRINEVLMMREDCEVEGLWEKQPAYGLRWTGSKGFRDHVKWIPTSMVDTAKEAVRRLRHHTAEARRIAAFYETRPGMLYLPAGTEKFRGREFLSTDEICCITGVSNPGSITHWLKSVGVESAGRVLTGRGSPSNLYRFSDVERVILDLLPSGFPVFDSRTGLRYSEAMLVIPRHTFSGTRAKWRCMFDFVSYRQISAGIGGTSPTISSVFERLGLSTDQRPLKVKSHQLRHWLNTLALKGGLSDIDVATWSGRKGKDQNAFYDHESGVEILDRKRRMHDRAIEKIRGAVGNPVTARGSISVLPKNLPVSRQRFSEMIVPNALSTEFGFCTHDFASSPCPMFAQCLNCTQHVCIKGYDQKQTEWVSWSLQLARQSLLKAREGGQSEFEGAAEWIALHSLTVQRLEQLHSILTNPEIPDGTVFHLNKSGQITLAEQAVKDRGEFEWPAAAAKPGIEQ